MLVREFTNKDQAPIGSFGKGQAYMFNVTPETHALLCLFIMTVAFLIAQIITHPDTTPEPKAEKVVLPKPASSH